MGNVRYVGALSLLSGVDFESVGKCGRKAWGQFCHGILPETRSGPSRLHSSAILERNLSYASEKRPALLQAPAGTYDENPRGVAGWPPDQLFETRGEARGFDEDHYAGPGLHEGPTRPAGGIRFPNLFLAVRLPR